MCSAGIYGRGAGFKGIQRAAEELSPPAGLWALYKPLSKDRTNSHPALSVPAVPAEGAEQALPPRDGPFVPRVPHPLCRAGAAVPPGAAGWCLSSSSRWDCSPGRQEGSVSRMCSEPCPRAAPRSIHGAPRGCHSPGDTAGLPRPDTGHV